ncbi:MAG TPA: hypothetical protein VES67_26620 [Vicinamibacterales bacterium]|nr:hypothetical protein [Vicinamibacterales bacterium]
MANTLIVPTSIGPVTIRRLVQSELDLAFAAHPDYRRRSDALLLEVLHADTTEELMEATEAQMRDPANYHWPTLANLAIVQPPGAPDGRTQLSMMVPDSQRRVTLAIVEFAREGRDAALRVGHDV